MSNSVKAGLYLVLVILAVWFGRQFYRSFTSNSRAMEDRISELPGENRAKSPSPPPRASSNNPSVKAETNVVESAGTNSASAQTNTNGAASPVSSNTPASGTNDALVPVAENNAESPSNASPVSAAEPATGTLASVNQPLPRSSANMIGYLGAFVGTMILLGLLIANDASQFFGSRSVDFLFNDKGEGMRNPEYEEAESVWANGDHMEAIRLMRLYLGRNPREQYVALRIAEIYEKDLHNYLAAALEYEEVLKNKIEPERWGWAAIHLCNLYSKMGQTDKAVALLRRIESEYAGTAASEKARKRLALFDSGGEQGLQPEEPPAPREF